MSDGAQRRAANLAGRLLAALIPLLLAAFFGFVGYMKATAPLALLAQHHAWTVWIPAPLGRLVGWSEMLCAVGLLGLLAPGSVARVGSVAAAVLVVNQLVAAAVHLAQGEAAALPQNGVIIALLLVAAALRWPLQRAPLDSPGGR